MHVNHNQCAQGDSSTHVKFSSHQSHCICYGLGALLQIVLWTNLFKEILLYQTFKISQTLRVLF